MLARRRALAGVLATSAVYLLLLPGATSAGAAGGIAYVGRVASGKSTSTSTTATLNTSASVSAGSSLVISVLLGGTGTGTVAVSDPAGDTYTVNRDQGDVNGNRLLVVSAENVKALASGTQIKVTFPSASSWFITVDDFSGVAAVDSGASAVGPAGSFNSGSVTASSGELLYGVVGVVTKGGSTWGSGWTALSSLSTASRRLAPADRIAGSAGPYSASGTAKAAWIAGLVSFTPLPPPEAPPVAKLSVSPSSGAPPLAVTADASASSDTDSSPISTYTFNFGDGTTVGPQPGATATHTYQNAGTFTVTVTVTDTAGLSSNAASSVNVTSATGAQAAVYAGYYDTHHANTQPKPSPWMGSPNAVFVGTPDSSSGGWDSAGVRIDNLSGSSLPFVSVTVSIGTHSFALWNTTSLPAGETLILAQTAFENFDGSDTNPAGCYGCSATTCTTEVQSTIPVVHVTIDGVTTNYPDPQQTLNTHGVDSAGCPYTGTRNDESEAWQQLTGSSP